MAAKETRMTDMGWPGYGPFRYTHLREPELSAELARLSRAKTVDGVHCVNFQPSPNPDERIQDRYVVQDWQMSDGVWKFLAVFDGHAGHDTVDHTAAELPSQIKSALSPLLASRKDGSPPSPSAVSAALVATIAAFDDSITAGVAGLFPGGIDEISSLSDKDIQRVINDDGDNSARLARATRGSTAVIALLDPSRNQLWVAGLGDSQAVLVTEDTSGAFHASVLSSYHNGEDADEAQRVRNEHPGENYCIHNGLVLGALAVTRALGDTHYKLPAVYTNRVFLNFASKFKCRIGVDQLAHRIHTPPYVSNVAEVRHVDLRTSSPTALILCSDGLLDLYECTSAELIVLKAAIWAGIVGGPGREQNLALRLLRHALGGENEEMVSRAMTVELAEWWMDDTTVIVLPLRSRS